MCQKSLLHQEREFDHESSSSPDIGSITTSTVGLKSICDEHRGTSVVRPESCSLTITRLHRLSRRLGNRARRWSLPSHLDAIQDYEIGAFGGCIKQLFKIFIEINGKKRVWFLFSLQSFFIPLVAVVSSHIGSSSVSIPHFLTSQLLILTTRLEDLFPSAHIRVS